MPHQVVHRLRRNPLRTLLRLICGLGPDPEYPEDDIIDEGRYATFVKVCEEQIFGFITLVMDVIAGLLFVVGSVYFIPDIAEVYPEHGALMFLAGGVIYLFISMYDLFESLHHGEGVCSYETAGAVLFLLGSVFYFIGTFEYWPDSIDVGWIMTVKAWFNFNGKSAYSEGTWLFIFGSLWFCIGSYLNSLNLGALKGQDEMSRRLLSSVTQSFLVGSVLFLVGSVAFLPQLVEAGELMEGLGAWLFVFGSIFFILAPLLSIWRTSRYLQMQICDGGSEDGEGDSLVESDARDMMLAMHD
mmetsp:Transcript_26648/g.61290  ORF Transcript_26648/g.61290 Transcript_26648/m.61290 type:complete len:299 (+) Transcript_26648:62-958(+)